MFSVIKSRILYNEKVGISLVGENGEASIEDNIIDNNGGPGVKIGIANRASVLGCHLHYN